MNAITRAFTAFAALALLIPVATGAEGDKNKDLEDLAALAEKQVNIKRACVKVADAQKMIVEAKLRVLKAAVDTAQEDETQAKTTLKRIEEGSSKGVVAQRDVDEARTAYRRAQAVLREAQEKLAVGEGEVALEAARREVAVAELDEAELRLKQARERLK